MCSSFVTEGTFIYEFTSEPYSVKNLVQKRPDMKIIMMNIKYFLALLVSGAILLWICYYLNNITAAYSFGLLGILLFYFSYRALFRPIEGAELKGQKEFFKIKSLETIFYLMAFGLGIYATGWLVINMFKILMP